MFGIGLRSLHYPFLEKRPKTDLNWFEAISENYMDTKGRPLRMLAQIRMDYAVALHGVGLSLASSSDLDNTYIKNLKNLVDRIDPFIVSDHLCWTGSATHNLHDLLPFPFTKEALHHISQKISKIQEILKKPLVIENISSYLQFKNNDFSEWDFLAELAKKSGCEILLDLNNVYVSAKNHNFDPMEFISHIPLSKVRQIHLAGHIDTGEYLFDTHSKAVCDDVWLLYEKVARFAEQEIPTLIEWDDEIPEFHAVQAQALLAKEKWNNVRKKSSPQCSNFSQTSAQRHSLI